MGWSETTGRSTGIQVHVGPTNYDDEKRCKPFLLDPGQEISMGYFIRRPTMTRSITFRASSGCGPVRIT